MQPVHGGPVYVFRNVMDNVAVEPFKLHNSPSGCLIFHNTSVKKGTAARALTPEAGAELPGRGTTCSSARQADYAFETTAPMVDCDFDYDGFGGGPFKLFLKWNDVRYATMQEGAQKAPAFKHAVLLHAPTAFLSGALRLRQAPAWWRMTSTCAFLPARRPSTPEPLCLA